MYNLMESSSNANDGLLSNLPDDVLTDVLSLLPTVEAVKTSVLSRRWRSLWKYVHNVDVCLEDFGDNNSPDIIHLLSLFQTPKVWKFQVKLPSSINSIEGVVRSCVQLAFDHHVEDVALECFEDVYLPSKIFNISSVAKLNLVEGKSHLPPVVSLPLLRFLREFVLEE